MDPINRNYKNDFIFTSDLILISNKKLEGKLKFSSALSRLFVINEHEKMKLPNLTKIKYT